MTMRTIATAAGLLAACVAFAAPAVAADGFALTRGSLNAGPASDYPRVGTISRGEPLTVYGCLARYSWCDVSASGERGWFPGRRIAFERDGRRVPLPAVATVVGLTIVGFAVNDYWGEHYRSRPWFEDRRWRQGPREGRGPRPEPRPRAEVPAPRGQPGAVGGPDPRPGREARPPIDTRRTAPDLSRPMPAPGEQRGQVDTKPVPRTGVMPAGADKPAVTRTPAANGMANPPCTENCR